MAVRIGAYVPAALKASVARRARAARRTLSEELVAILEEGVWGRRPPPGVGERRAPGSAWRRRRSDPVPRRRAGDLPASGPAGIDPHPARAARPQEGARGEEGGACDVAERQQRGSVAKVSSGQEREESRIS